VLARFKGKVPDRLMAIPPDDDLIRYTKYSKDLYSKEKRKARHSEKEETQEGGVNIMPSFTAHPLASFSRFFFYFSSSGFCTLNFSLSSAVFLLSLKCKPLLYLVYLIKIAIRPLGTLLENSVGSLGAKFAQYSPIRCFHMKVSHLALAVRVGDLSGEALYLLKMPSPRGHLTVLGASLSPLQLTPTPATTLQSQALSTVLYPTLLPASTSICLSSHPASTLVPLKLNMNPTNEIDPDGDVIAIFPTTSTKFRVSSRILSLASPVFRAMFSPHSLRGVALASATALVEVEFPDGSPQALEAILNILHFRHDCVSENVSYDFLYEIALVVHKYDLVEALELWGEVWLRGARGGKGLFAMYVFGDREGFRKECQRAILQSHGYDCNLNGGSEKGKETEMEEENDWDSNLVPTRVLGKIYTSPSDATCNYS